MSENADEYSGWKNRETWATALVLGNDQGLDSEVREIVKSAIEAGEATHNAARDGIGMARDYSPMIQLHYAADAVKEYVGELCDPNSDVFSGDIQGEIGSLWRVDWEAVAESFLEES